MKLRIVLPLIGLIPLIVSSTQLWTFILILSNLNINTTYYILLIVILSNIVYLHIFEQVCEKYHKSLQDERISPFGSAVSRTLYVTGLGLLYGFGIATLLKATSVIKGHDSLGSVLVLSGYIDLPYYILILFLCSLPVISLLAFWIFHLVKQIRNRLLIYQHAEEIDPAQLDFQPDVTILEIEGTNLKATSYRLLGIKPVIIINSELIEMPNSELKSIYYHERHHLRYNHSLTCDLLTILPPVAISKNIFLILIDMAAIERNADQHAVDKIDDQTFKFALYRARTMIKDNSQESTTSISQSPPISYSFALLFGNTILEKAHPHISDRPNTSQ